MSERLQTAVVITVLVVWVLNFTASLAPFLDYSPVESINGIFGIVITSVVALGKKRSNGDA